jgi:polyketide synthase 12
VVAGARRAEKGESSFAGRLRAVTEESARIELVTELVVTQVASVLAQDPGEVGLDRAFAELGFDSLAAVELRNRLAAELGLELPATVVFDHPSSGALAAHLLEAINGGDGEGPAEAELSRLEATLGSVAEDDPGRAAIADRLRALVASFDRARPAARSDLSSTVESASDEELMRLIDNKTTARG